MNTELSTVDDVLHALVTQKSETAVLGFPAFGSDGDKSRYDIFTAYELNKLVDAASSLLEQLGVQTTTSRIQNNGPRTSSGVLQYDDVATVVALFGLSSLDYLITMLALSRTGVTVLLLSPRLSTEALLSLLKDADCSVIISQPSLDEVVKNLQRARKLTHFHLPRRSEYVHLAHRRSDPKLNGLPRHTRTASKNAYIMHSSGSTSMPKLIYITHRAGLGTFAASPNGDRALCTVPLYHTHGHSTLYRTLYGEGSIFFLDPNRAITTSGLVSAMKTVRPESVYTVPYTLKLLAESRECVEMMKSCKFISVSGSKCPDELGDWIVSQGIHLVIHFGSTEAGGLMNSSRPRDDKTWNYLRPLPNAKPFIFMKKLDFTTYEMVVLDGHASKVISNSDDPPNSLHSRDIFSPHPSIPDAWKYIGRLDDRVTLLNGEKILPLPIEGRIRQHHLVREAVVFGIGKTVPGLLLFKSEYAQAVSDEDFITQVWPTIAEANSAAESFSQIGRDMVIPLQAEVDYPRTDKSTIIRAKLYDAFADDIEAAYRANDTEDAHDKRRLNMQEAISYLQRLLNDDFALTLTDDTSDLFSAGLDSLMAMQLAKRITKDLYLGEIPAVVDQNTVYDKGNIRNLASYLHAVQSGELEESTESQAEIVENLIETYSNFVPHASCSQTSSASSVLLTGATGSLGSHILACLLLREDIDRIYCLTRAKSAAEAEDRIKKALLIRGITVPASSLDKITAFPADLSTETLGLNTETLEELRRSLKLIVHCAWAVNFNVSVRSFEEQHIKATHNLIALSLSVQLPQPARFVFCSSISVASGLSASALVPEDIVGDSQHLPKNGYGQSKYVAERIVLNANAQDADAVVLRIGQIVGDTVKGLWNSSEAVPLLIRTADALRCLPCLDEACSWLPVDFAARTILDITFDSDVETKKSIVYNVLNPSIFHWTRDLLPALRESNLAFDAVETQEWLQRLRQSDQDPAVNPSVKLLSFWEQAYARETASRSLRFTTEAAERTSPTLRSVPDLIHNGYISRFVEAWTQEWRNC